MAGKSEIMKDFLIFLSILQLTKEQPLTGYLSAGIRIHECPSLAEHHYTAAMVAYFLGQKIKQAGGVFDDRKLLLMVMFHDLGELFGGDISAPLNRKYPDLREYKDKIGTRAMNMLESFLDEEMVKEFHAIYDECEHGTTDEKIVAKIVDQLDHQFFLEHLNYDAKVIDNGENDYRTGFVQKHIIDKADGIKDPVTQKVVREFLHGFMEHCYRKGFQPRNLLLDKEM